MNDLTKEERRAIAREEKRKEREKEESLQKVKKLITYAVLLLIGLFVGYKAYQYFTRPVAEVVAEPIEIASTDHVKGSEEAEVVLFEYGDFQCPACGAYYPILKEVSSNFEGDVKIVYRHFPLITIHPNAFPAAKAAEAAGKQDRFWEMHDILFEKQSEWEKSNNSEDIFLSYAKELGLDEQKYQEDFSSSEVNDKIQADMTSGNKLKVDATPTFFLNGKKISPRSYEEFRTLIESEISN